MTESLFRPSVLAAKERLSAARADIQKQHADGSPGIQVCTRLTTMLDDVVLDLYRAITAELPPPSGKTWEESIALVAHGGYGRQDVAPYSDVDLMLLHDPADEAAVAPLAQQLLRDVFDTGLSLGQSVRTVDQAVRLAKEDATVATSLMESRLLWGSERLMQAYSERFLRNTRARAAALIPIIEHSRRDERKQFGETIYLLEPNVKRSRGGLRDLQLLRWIGYVRYGVRGIKELQLQGQITTWEMLRLQQAFDFLLRLRNELHFHADKANDVLDRAEQIRIADWLHFRGREGILPVEEFMSEYFRHTQGVRSIVTEFVANSRPKNWFSRIMGAVFSHRIDGEYWVAREQISATRAGVVRLQTDLTEVLKLTDLANRSNTRIAPATWHAVRESVPKFSDQVSPATAQAFLSLLSAPAQLAPLLRRLHDLGALEKVIPAFKHARALLQFNEYHKYTVDEHCIRAVQCATEFANDTGPLGAAYRRIKQKRTLHLALLIHDLGKGFVEDHSIVGGRIAGEVGQQLGLPLRETETVKFLVLKHLVMAHLAMWRDTNDQQLILKFAVDVGSPEVLDMLYVLTAADISAVGPGVWNQWKAELLASLHHKAMLHLAGDTPTSEVGDRLTRRKSAIRAALGNVSDRGWFERLLESLPTNYLLGTPVESVAGEMRDLQSLGQGDVHASGRYQPDSHTVEFVVGTHEDVAPGIFHRLTGALSGQGLQILSAEIHTLVDGLVFDRFSVHDPDYADAPPVERIEKVTAALVRSLNKDAEPGPVYRKVWRATTGAGVAAVATAPAQVRIDNGTSEGFTIVDVFASDRMGLLHTITRTLFELNLSVGVAKIGTHLDQVVDVFYVTDSSGRKISEEHRIQEIRDRLLAAIEALTE
jgi:[protein-PII] uridylyltransferase